MAKVYLAELSTLGGFRRKVALKIVRSEFARDPKFAQLMAREAMIGSRLQHPNIVETLEFNEADGRMFLALEFVEGQTVEDLLSQSANEGHKGLPLDLAMEITIQVLKGLSYAHNLTSPEGEEMGIIHRDLKPGNIMVSRHGSVKVMDFGIAKAKVACATITAAGQVRGTPIYMAPEQVTGKPLDARCDQFAVATLLYELVTGEQLFIARNLIDIMRRVARAEVGDGPRRLERCMPGLGEVVERMWSVSSEGRYADCQDSAHALEELLPAVRERMSQPEPGDTIDVLPPISEDEEPTVTIRRSEQAPTRDVPIHTEANDEEESTGGWLGSLFRRKEKKPEPKKKRRKKRRRSDDSGRVAAPGQRHRQGESGGLAPPGPRRRRKKKRRTSAAGAPHPGETTSQPIEPPPGPEPPEPAPDPVEAAGPEETEPEIEEAPKVAQLGPASPPTEDEPSFDGSLRPEPTLAEAAMSFPPERPPARGDASDSLSMIWEESTFGESTEGPELVPVTEEVAKLDLQEEHTADGFEVQSSPLLRQLAESEAAIGPEVLSVPEPEPEPVLDATARPQTPVIGEKEPAPGGSTSVTWTDRPPAELRGGTDEEVDDGAPMDPFFLDDDDNGDDDGDGDDGEEADDDAPMDSFFFED